MNKLKDLDSLDLDLNYKSVCENLVRGNRENAYEEFKKLALPWIETDNLIIFRLFLNSLNYAVYYYVLFMYDISLYKCCYHCTLLMHKDINSENLIHTATIILDEYYDEMISRGIIVDNPLLKAVFEYIEDNISNSISLESASNHVHVNKSYLSQIFKNKTGYTFSSYVNNRKLNKARELLINTNKSIIEISEECGYKNSSYFSSIFTKKTGFSPINFRKNNSVYKSRK